MRSIVSSAPRQAGGGICVAALLAIACWACAPTGIRIALLSYTPSQVALLRFVVASLMFFFGVASAKGVARVRAGDLGWIASLAWFGVAAHHLALNQGQQWVSAGAASCLAQTAPIFTVLLARPVLGEVVSPRHWGCVLLGLGGAAVIIGGSSELSASWVGGALVLLAASSWGVYFTLQRRAAWRMDAVSVSCYTIWAGTLMLIPFGWQGLGGRLAHASTSSDLAIVALGIFPSAVAYVAWSHVLRHVEASRASPLLFAIPPVAMLIALPVLHETPGPELLPKRRRGTSA